MVSFPSLNPIHIFSTPFHKKDLPKGTLFEILKQADISKEELKNLL